MDDAGKMTREEALQILDTIPTIGEQVDALDMAIKALEQEPCEDAISREMALKECHDIVVDGERYRVIQEETLLGLPSVNPQEPRWIPVSERLPEENGYYLTTTMYHEVYCDYWVEDRFNRTEAVIAWMPLPKPYEPQERSDKDADSD